MKDNNITAILSRVAQTKRYKIIGGSYGADGTLTVNNNRFNVYAAKNAKINKEDIKSIYLNQLTKTKKFSLFSALMGILFTVVMTMAFNIFGFIAGVLLTIFGSSYTVKDAKTASIELKNGGKIEVSGNVDRLVF